MDCAVTLFPEPLSPTSATISPSLIERKHVSQLLAYYSLFNG